MKELDQCQNTCMAILRMDKENDAATVMMADLSYRRNEYGTAMYHFQQLLGWLLFYLAPQSLLFYFLQNLSQYFRVVFIQCVLTFSIFEA